LAAPLSKNMRLVLVVGLIVGLTVLVRASGLSQWLDSARIQALVAQAGPWGPLAFVALFVGAVVSQIPGLLFVFVAPALFRLPQAFALCFVASNLAVTLNFELVRRLGGQPLGRVDARGSAREHKIENPRLRRLFERLDAHPVRTVALLRAITIMFPPVTSALALTQVRARDHALGSALGMLLPILAVLYATSVLLVR
jgi:uncharacterized membrane protein YdjX (TVP38/TMEM64 family)